MYLLQHMGLSLSMLHYILRQNYRLAQYLQQQLYLIYCVECFNNSASLEYTSRVAETKCHLTVAIQAILPAYGQ